jgi:hypothetical protein
VEGPLQVPVAAGEPVKELNKLTAEPLEHTDNVPAAPALGGVFTVTVTVAVASAQGDVPVTVYVYVPAVLVPGVNVPRLPPVKVDGPVHEPVPAGDPVKELNRLTDEPPEHTVFVPLLPALGAVLTVTTTVAVAVGEQGDVPVTV